MIYDNPEDPELQTAVWRNERKYIIRVKEKKTEIIRLITVCFKEMILHGWSLSLQFFLRRFSSLLFIMRDFDFLLWTQTTIEREMFAFMLQLSFYQNISFFTLRLPAACYREASTLKVLFHFEILNGDFLSNIKPQHEVGKALVKLINGTFHHRMSWAHPSWCSWWIKYFPRWENILWWKHERMKAG